MKKITSVLLFGVLMLLTSCTVTHVIDLRPNYNAYLRSNNIFTSIRPPMNFYRGRFQDKRFDPSKIGTYKKGLRKYNLSSTRPLEEVIFEGLRSLIVRSGHKWTNARIANVLVDMELLNIESRQEGEWTVGRIRIHLNFVDNTTGKVFYSNTYTGSESAGIGSQGLSDMREALNVSLISFLHKVGNDVRLARYLKGYF